MRSTPPTGPLTLGFVSTRFAGTDGVSLEAAKWAEVLEQLGHRCCYFSGECDRAPENSLVVPEAFFGHEAVEAIATAAFSDDWGSPELLEFANPDIHAIYNTSFFSRLRPPHVTRRIQELTGVLKAALYRFARDFEVHALVVENALAIPMNLPLGLALTEFIAETGIPAIAHHHDFYWERQRYLVNCIGDYLAAAFPPALPSIRHVVINTQAARQLSWRTGENAMIIPNVMDYARPPGPPDFSREVIRAALGVAPGEKLILQPTRVLPRKGIEHAVELTRRLERPARLVVSHASGDEGNEYEGRVRDYARLLGVNVNFVSDVIGEKRGVTPDGRQVYSLWDIYPHADLVTYPSTIEGFGNAFLEAIYFCRPIVVNNYSIFDTDIQPKGFRVITFDGYITSSTVRQTGEALDDPERTAEVAAANYALAERHFSYAVLKRRLQTLLADIFGEP
jgi:glycosyltransferase involved in cell wall biosynthesis